MDENYYTNANLQQVVKGDNDESKDLRRNRSNDPRRSETSDLRKISGRSAQDRNVGRWSNRLQERTENPGKLLLTYNDYSDALLKSIKLNVYGAMVDPHSANSLINNNTKVFLSDDKSCGVAVETNGNITGVFKNPNLFILSL